jgi:hypothetical protein
LLVLVGVLGLVWAQPALVSGESLAEIARRERERREKVQKGTPDSGTTITDEELKAGGKRRRTATDSDSGAAEEASSGSTASATGGTTGSAAAKEGEDRSSLQQFWKERLDAARDAVKTAEARVKEAEEAARPTRSGDTSYDATMAAGDAQRERAAAAAQARQDLEEARRALAEVEAEARQAGGTGGS